MRPWKGLHKGGESYHPHFTVKDMGSGTETLRILVKIKGFCKLLRTSVWDCPWVRVAGPVLSSLQAS